MLAAAALVQPALALPKGFTMQKNDLKDLWSSPIEMHWLDSDRALVLCRLSHIKIAMPYENGIPMEDYLQLGNGYQTDETGTLSMALDPDFHNGSPYIYVYWGSKTKPHGMRISRFLHSENAGGLTSRADFGTLKNLWHDTDGWGKTPQWHYGKAGPGCPPPSTAAVCAGAACCTTRKPLKAFAPGARPDNRVPALLYAQAAR